ncbi:MAG: cobyrinate a,c-diamide synthase [Nitrososphaeraceae archaeon]
MSNIPKLVIAGVTSGVGKTVVSAAFMYGLKKRGLRVQPFKVGPDFIDPSYHSYITGRQSRNLDIWMMGETGVLNSFNKACCDADLAVIEGVMGLFDGISGKGQEGSTAAIAKLLRAEVVLVIDSSKAARSIAAIALGFQNFDKELSISGVVLNNIASDRHERLVKEAFADKIRVPIVGIIRRDQELKNTERHLGLIPAAELDSVGKSRLLANAKRASEQIYLDRLGHIWKVSPMSSVKKQEESRLEAHSRIAVALDESFNFYYIDNLEFLRERNLELVYFSPLSDKRLPEDISGLIIGGGFPEIMAKRLETNKTMIKSIKKFAQDGLPVLAECGGLMYLTKYLHESEDESSGKSKLVGLIDAETQMGSKLTLNYTEANCDGSILGTIGKVRGHEFHYSKIKNIAKDSKFAFHMTRGSGITKKRDGFVVHNCLASYTHLHFSNKRLLKHLVTAFLAYGRR